MRFRDGDTLIARITPCLENGKTAYVTSLGDGVVGHGSTEFIVLSGREGVSDNLFAYYLARSDSFRAYAIGHMEGTSGRQRVPTDAIARFVVDLPPLDEQRAIAGTLGALDDKIELNRRMNRTLEEIARAIFRSWFVDFDPVRAKAAGRQPAGLDAETAALFPDAFEDSELGPIPAGWCVRPLSEVLKLNPLVQLRKGEVAPYLEMSNVPTQGHRAMDWVERPFGSGSKFMNGDVLLARITPCLENGKTALVDFLRECQIGWGSTEFIVMRG
ncbi:MAG: restriction endonuclease subunit S, partial [Bryobacteraceae bacterium]|nr:restriction endonuclease subunit S [Bryobacteraceae bacterium]